MLDEFKNVLCDECEEPLDRHAYRVDYDGCYCENCAFHFAREDLENAAHNTCVSIDRVDITDFVEEY